MILDEYRFLKVSDRRGELTPENQKIDFSKCFLKKLHPIENWLKNWNWIGESKLLRFLLFEFYKKKKKNRYFDFSKDRFLAIEIWKFKSNRKIELKSPFHFYTQTNIVYFELFFNFFPFPIFGLPHEILSSSLFFPPLYFHSSRVVR